jgi:hypothetical protein
LGPHLVQPPAGQKRKERKENGKSVFVFSRRGGGFFGGDYLNIDSQSTPAKRKNYNYYYYSIGLEYPPPPPPPSLATYKKPISQ